MNMVCRCVLIVLFLLVILTNPANIYSCGPFFPTTVFVHQNGPDFNVDTYVGGNLGIVQPQFTTLYLFVAYRHLTGHPLSMDDQQLIHEAMPVRTFWYSPSAALQAWMNARTRAIGPGPQPRYPVDVEVRDEHANSLFFFTNINDDAFRNAADTLGARMAQFGAPHPYLSSWVSAQDDVFLSADSGRVPPPADPTAPPILQADRAYQIAAAHFYMRHFGIAESLFTRIGKDRSSPWNKIARYLVARAKIREATLTPANKDSVLQYTKNYMLRLMRDSSMNEYRPSLQSFVNLCRFQTEPEKYFLDLDRKFSRSRLGPLFPVEWEDYKLLLPDKKDSSGLGKSDFADWKSCYQHNITKETYEDYYRRQGTRYLARKVSELSSPMWFDYAYERWRATHSQAWLIAALSNADTTKPRLDTLLRAVAGLSPTAPAYGTANYWKVHLLVEKQRDGEAKKLIQELLASKSLPVSISKTNLLLSERARMVTSFDEFLKYCHLRPYGINWDYGDLDQPLPDTTAELFAENASILNKLVPLAKLQSACLSSSLPVNLQSALVRATWTRSVLLGQEKIALELSPLLASLNPQLKPFAEQYQSAPDGPSRRFTAAFMFLKFPGLSPYVRIGVLRSEPLDERDGLRDNWWYTGNLAIEATADNVGYERHPRPFAGDADSLWHPSFLTKSEKEIALAQTRSLYDLPAAASYLSRITTAWAKDHSRDPRVPEALHLTVHLSRVGCKDSLSSEICRKAFTILHKQYPESEWTKKTKYWYE